MAVLPENQAEVMGVLSFLDLIIIGVALVLFVWLGVRSKSSGSGFESRFLGGGKLPWWVAGTSMVATTFAADTPLAVSELVAQGGIAQNWLWWSFIFGGILTAVIFAPLWKRSGVGTELEFITLRYSGKAATNLRKIKSVYLGLFMNVLILAWVNLAMFTILKEVLQCSSAMAYACVFGLFVLSAIYSHVGGLRGVAYADVLQFVLAMGGCIVLAVVIINSDDVGGFGGLMDRVPESYFKFFPDLSASSSDDSPILSLTLGAFMAFFAVQWWASWYPGAEPGGGGYVAQRFLGTKDPRDAKKATLLFQIGHYCLRPWPWIIVGLCAVALYNPDFQSNYSPEVKAIVENHIGNGGNLESLASNEQFVQIPDHQTVLRNLHYEAAPRLGFVYALVDFLPSGLLGLLIIAFIAAYMSTIGTQLNWGGSYLYRDFAELNWPNRVKKNPEKVALWIQVILLFVGAFITLIIQSISGVWMFILECGAGLGLVLILRWFWPRINVWSEISATLAPLLFYSLGLGIKASGWLSPETLEVMDQQHIFFFITVVGTTVTWIFVTFLTPPEPREQLQAFATQVQPPWGNWGVDQLDQSGRGSLIIQWLTGVIFVLSTLFLIGSLFFHPTHIVGYGLSALVSGWIFFKHVNQK